MTSTYTPFVRAFVWAITGALVAMGYLTPEQGADLAESGSVTLFAGAALTGVANLAWYLLSKSRAALVRAS